MDKRKQNENDMNSRHLQMIHYWSADRVQQMKKFCLFCFYWFIYQHMKMTNELCVESTIQSAYGKDYWTNVKRVETLTFDVIEYPFKY